MRYWSNMSLHSIQCSRHSVRQKPYKWTSWANRHYYCPSSTSWDRNIWCIRYSTLLHVSIADSLLLACIHHPTKYNNSCKKCMYHSRPLFDSPNSHFIPGSRVGIWFDSTLLWWPPTGTPPCIECTLHPCQGLHIPKASTRICRLLLACILQRNSNIFHSIHPKHSQIPVERNYHLEEPNQQRISHIHCRYL